MKLRFSCRSRSALCCVALFNTPRVSYLFFRGAEAREKNMLTGRRHTSSHFVFYADLGKKNNQPHSYAWNLLIVCLG
jgi:hypothetical protein